jgi:hypothetical protein
MNKLHFLQVLLLSFLFVACEKSDKAIVLPPKGDGTAIQVNMGEEYDEHYYVSLENQSIVHSAKSSDWQLAFTCLPDDHSVYMNGGIGINAYPTGKSGYDQVGFNDTVGIGDHWRFDPSCGGPDSSVLGQWQKGNQVFIIRMGKTSNNFKKLKISSADLFQYTIEVGDLNSTQPTKRTIIKTTDVNFVYFSLNTLEEVVGVEPLKTTYDLHFTTYNYSFYDQTPVLQYTVVGCLLNPLATSAYKDSVLGYDHFNKSNIQALSFSSLWDAIGYDWKKIDWASGSTDFVIDKRYTFIIRTQSNRYFKLRFLDFYGATGEKGSPKFEFVEL